MSDFLKTYELYQNQAAERLHINLRHAEEGVLFADPSAAYIDARALIGKGTFIGPCVVIEGETFIGEDCRIEQNTRIRESRIGNGVRIEQSVITESEVGDRANIGPFAYLRPGSRIGDDVKVGDFVEVKNSTMGTGAKASHLTYIGDSDIGAGVNLGCGVVFVNFDGSDKHRSVVGDGAFIGCNVNIVYPVTIGAGSYVAAGTTLTEDLPAGALAVGRTKQRVVEGWVAKRGLIK
jgi:bifunctional UDP-N-acetylglucosamine pyrophosphorylase/glucosamine-1-phosphate N-acetyltransferase